MYAPTAPTISWRPQHPTGVTTASVTAVALLTLVGSGSVYNLDRVENWLEHVKGRVPFIVDVKPKRESAPERLDVRTAEQHISNIRQVLNPAVSDLAAVFNVSRQAIYKWLSGDASPEPEKLARIQKLSAVADAFRDAGVSRASALVKMKAFEGRSLLDLIATGELRDEHVRALVDEGKAMESAYERSGLAASKAKPSSGWKSSVSIPGSID